MHSGLESPIASENPIGVEGMLDSGRRMDRVRGVVVGINDGRWRNSPARGDVGVVNRLKSAHPSILCEVVVVHAKASAQDGISRGSERVRSSDTRSKGPPIVIRRGVDERRLLWIQRDKKRV